MTTEQLAIVVPASVAVLTVWMTVRHQAKVNRQNLDSQRKLAIQERVRATYEDMLHMVNWVMEVVDVTQPVFEYEGMEKPETPDIDRVRAVQAKIGVHGSPEVKEILQRWIKRRNEFFVEADLLDAMREAERRGREVEKSYGQSVPAKWREVADTRRELHGLVRELEDAVSTEMRA
jgi:hypothetical protein